MTKIDLRTGRRAGALAIALAVLVTLIGFTRADAVSAPSSLAVVGVADTGIALSWDPVDGAALYRVRIATSADMSQNGDTIDVATTSYDWRRLDPNPAGAGAGLTPGTKYYFQVKALTASRGNLTGYSSAVSASTSSDGPESTLLAPSRVVSSAAGATSLYLSWSERGPGVNYRVRYSTSGSGDVNSWPSADFTTSGGILSGLDAGTTYYLRIRVLSRAGEGLSDYSAPVRVATPASLSSPRLTIVSYNILKTGSSPSWASRRAAVVAGIKAADPELVALQEALPTKVTAANGTKVAQYTDVLQLLGSRYAYVTTAYSSGTHLAYDKTRLSVLGAGSKKLKKLGSSPRYAVWAILEDKVSHKRMFVVDTHLEPTKSSSASKAASVRAKQAKQILSLAKSENPSNYPVVVAGDMNSSRATKPSNSAYAAFISGGLVDPHGNANATYVPTVPPAEHVIDAAYNSYNGLQRRARRTIWTLGTSVDYILFSPGIRVGETRTVVDLDQNGQFVGTIPSDHNMLVASFHLA